MRVTASMSDERRVLVARAPSDHTDVYANLLESEGCDVMRVPLDEARRMLDEWRRDGDSAVVLLLTTGRAGSRPPDAERLEFGPFTLAGSDVETPAGTVRLRRAEARFFAELVRARGRTVSTSELARTVLGRGDGTLGSGAAVRRQIANLRAALSPLDVIETVRRIGYRVKPGDARRLSGETVDLTLPPIRNGPG